MRWLLLGLSLFAHGATAEVVVGKVVGITDGHSLTVLDAAKRRHRIRLADIDSPAEAQAFGERSKQSLTQLCAGKVAEVEVKGKDQSGLTFGRVRCTGVDANVEQVRRGLAWVYDGHAPKNSPLYAIQSQAQSGKHGLWVDKKPVPPWEWRAKARSAPKRK